MKKDRNTFFQEAQFAQYGNIPNQQMMMPNNMMMNQPTPMNQPIQAGMANNAYYYGPDINNDIDTKLAKMERQIRSLESRVNKLETNLNYTAEVDNVSNMYII